MALPRVCLKDIAGISVTSGGSSDLVKSSIIEKVGLVD